ncbi:hypothetical protein LP418_18895 [Nocardioides sp. B-3]|nr:hypothetical protein [Nocardioides sp. B-3]UUZ58279.1 hypothetical protein LP418_18895 [Nocardioides sp. B-3]
MITTRVEAQPQVGATVEPRRRGPRDRAAAGEDDGGGLRFQYGDRPVERGRDPFAELGEGLVVVVVLAAGPARGRALEPALERARVGGDVDALGGRVAFEDPEVVELVPAVVDGDRQFPTGSVAHPGSRLRVPLHPTRDQHVGRDALRCEGGAERTRPGSAEVGELVVVGRTPGRPAVPHEEDPAHASSSAIRRSRICTPGPKRANIS